MTTISTAVTGTTWMYATPYLTTLYLVKHHNLYNVANRLLFEHLLSQLTN